MALEDDMLQALEERLSVSKQVTRFVGVVQSASPLMVTQDGSTNPLPCLRLTSYTPAIGDRVAVEKYGAQYVVMGALA